jgi:4-amino-4-deoxychorismate lyase
MCLLLETIRIADNKLKLAEFHSARVNVSRKTLFHAKDEWNLSKLISVPDLDSSVIYRCRFIYSNRVERIEFLPYTSLSVKKLYLVISDTIEYSFKYENRKALVELRQKFTADNGSDILIVKNGQITDTSFSNIVFYDGKKWVTPSFPLLNGTKRAFYLSRRLISECPITPADLHKYQKARLINAMLDLDAGVDILMEDIV